MAPLNYNPPPTIKEFIKYYQQEDLFYSWIVGPVGSGKSTANFFKLAHMAKLQAKSEDGISHTRAVIVRNTLPQLKDTTLNTWGYWFREGPAGKWNATDKIFTLQMRAVAGGPIVAECEVLFRPLDTEDDVTRVLSLDINFAIVDEFVQIPRKIIDALSGRLGRYRAPNWAKPSVWGMWGASNPSTEDNWWHHYLHSELPQNARYFLQPSGLSPEAENLENLPKNYYTNLIVGKSETWIKQYVAAEWGFSTSGQPVTPGFKADVHVAQAPLLYNPLRALIVSLDPGIKGSAMLLGQEDHDGRLYILHELIQSGYGAERLISERLRPLLAERFPGARIRITGDPAAANRSQSDEKTVVSVFKKVFGRENVDIETNNRFPLRLDAMDYYFEKLIDGRPALQIDPTYCPVLIRALKGGWRYKVDTKSESIRGSDPEDNQYTHPGDTFGYFCRFFRRQGVRNEQYGARPRFIPPRSFGPSYHVT